MFAFGGWRLRRGDRRLQWWSWVTLAAVVASLGEYGLGWLAAQLCHAAGHQGPGVGPEVGGLYWLMNVLLPGYVGFRYPAKLWTFAALGISQLAARGWDDACGDGNAAAVTRFRRLILVTLAIAVAVGLSHKWFIAVLTNAEPDSIFGPLDVGGAEYDTVMGLAQTLVVSMLALELLRMIQRQHANLLAGLLLLVSVVDVAIAHRWMVPSVRMKSPAQLAAMSDYAADAKRVHSVSWFSSSWARTGSRRRMEQLFDRNVRTLGPKHHLWTPLGCVHSSGMLVPFDYFAIWQENAAHPGYQFDDYIFEALCTEQERARIVHEVTRLPALHSASPRATLRRSREVLDLQNREPIGKKTIVETDADLPAADLPAEERLAQESCQITADDPEHVVITAHLEGPGFVVLSDQYYPGWELTVDDGHGPKPASILRTNRVMRGVALPAGNFVLEYRYRPPLVLWGALLSGLTWLGVVVAAGRQFFWTRRKTSDDQVRRQPHNHDALVGGGSMGD